jgi:hypothetical protein
MRKNFFERTLAGVYIRKRALDVKPRALAGGSQLVAVALFTPLALAFPPRGEITARVGLVTVAFAVLASGVA